MNNKTIDNIGQLRLTDENCILMDNGTSNKWLIHAYKPTATNQNNKNLSMTIDPIVRLVIFMIPFN